MNSLFAVLLLQHAYSFMLWAYIMS